MHKLLSAAILLVSVLGLWSCNGENAQATAPHDNGWNASFRVEAGALTDDQLAQAGWVSAVATRNGIEVARAETTFTAHSVDIHIPTSGDVLLTLTGHVSKTDRTVVWSGAGTLTNGNATPDKNLVSLVAGPGLVTASSDLTISTSWQGVNLPAGTSYVCGSLIVDPAGISDTVKDSVVFIKDSLSFKKKVKKGSSFRLTLAGKNASLSYNWVIDTTVTTDANASDSTLRLDLASATPVIANTAPVAAEAVPVGRVTAASYVLKLKDAVLGKGQSIHYTLDGSIPTLASPAYDAAIGIVMNHPAALADTILPTKVNVSTIMDIGAFDAWQSNVVYSVSWGGTAVSLPRDTTLKSLVATNGKLNTAFDKSILAYTDTVEYDAVAAFFSAEPTDPTAEVSGLTASIGALAAGSTQKSIIRVTNTKNGVASKLEYVVTIYKRPQQVSVDSLLKTLSVAKGTLSPTFDPKVQTYVDEVAAGTTSETIVATAATGATITGTGSVNLTKDTTDVVVGVTNNGAKLDYKVTIVRKASVVVAPRDSVIKSNYAFDLTESLTDSAQIRSHYGYFVTHGAASTAKVTVSSGVLTFNWNLVYNAADGDYGTLAGLHLTLDSLFRTYDLSKVTAIAFQIKSSATATMNMNVLIEDDGTAYSKAAASALAALCSPAQLISTSWKTVTIAVSNFAMPGWLGNSSECSDDPACGKETFYSTSSDSISIAPHVKAFSFQPVVAWSNATTIRTNATGSFSIQNIVLTVKP